MLKIGWCDVTLKERWIESEKQIQKLCVEVYSCKQINYLKIKVYR